MRCAEKSQTSVHKKDPGNSPKRVGDFADGQSPISRTAGEKKGYILLQEKFCVRIPYS